MPPAGVVHGGGSRVEGPVLKPFLSLPFLPQSTHGVRRTMVAAPTCACCPRGSLSTRVPAPLACSFRTTARRARQVRWGAPAGGLPGPGMRGQQGSCGEGAAQQLGLGLDLGTAARWARSQAPGSGLAFWSIGPACSGPPAHCGCSPDAHCCQLPRENCVECKSDIRVVWEWPGSREVPCEPAPRGRYSLLSCLSIPPECAAAHLGFISILASAFRGAFVPH